MAQRFCATGLPLLLLALLAPAPVRADAPPALPPVKVGGLVQLDFRNAYRQFPDTVRHDFTIRRLRLSLSGRVHERVALTFVLADDRPTATNPVSVLDAFADVQLARALKLRTGQFKYEFDIEGREPDESGPMIDRSFATNAVAGALNGTSTASNPTASFRDRGLEVLASDTSGAVAHQLAAGIYEGGGRGTDVDNVYSWTFAARVSAHGLMANAGFLWGSDSYQAYAVGLDHVWRGNHARVEAHWARLKPRNEGVYLLDDVRVHPAVDVLGRWQVMVQDEGPQPTIRGVDGGIRFWLMRGGVRTNNWIAIEYMWRDADPPLHLQLTSLNDNLGVPITKPDQVGDVLMVRFQLYF